VVADDAAVTSPDVADREEDNVSRGKWVRIVSLGVAFLVVVGCGSGADDDADPGAGVDATVAEPVTTEPVTTEPVTTEPVTTEPATTEPATTEPVDGGDQGEDGDVCAALEGIDLDAMLAEPAGQPTASGSDAMGAVCLVDPLGDSHAGFRLVVTTQAAADNFDNQRELLGVDSEVEGLGERAFHTGPYLFVQQGDTLVFIQVLRDIANGIAVDDVDMEAAMRIILDNLAG
jgi:hypothetical protein